MTTQIDFEQARFNMIEQQIRTWEVLDLAVLELLNQIHREDFVPADYSQFALADINIPLANNQVMMTPKVEARLLQALTLNRNDNVLEIGTGSGYLTALLARSARHVESIDLFSEFSTGAKALLTSHQIDNVQLDTCDFYTEWQPRNSYDAIVVTGSIPAFDFTLQEKLAVGGRLFVIVGESPIMEAMLVTRIGDKEWANESLFETELPALIGVEKPSRFEF